MAFLLERDTLSGKLGTATVTVDGKVHELFRAREIKVVADIQTKEMKALGTTRIQPKNIGVRQTGSGVLYFGSDLLTQMALDYMETGKVTYFDLQVTNSDPTATVGEQTMVYYGCKLSGEVLLSILDVDNDMLEQPFTFSYTSAKKLAAFSAESDYGV